MQNPQIWKEIRSWVLTLGTAVILALVLRENVVATTLVDGPSMQPTLHTGDYLFVDRASYKFGPPHYGDVVVFHSPVEAKDYIKRVIGLPGDKIAVHDNHVYRNGKRVDESFLKVDTIASGQNTWNVGKKQIFVMGDNRPNSSDSRAFGPIDLSRLVGKARLRIWPLNKISTF